MGSYYHTADQPHLRACPRCGSTPCYWIDAWSSFWQAECGHCVVEAEVEQPWDASWEERQKNADAAWDAEVDLQLLYLLGEANQAHYDEAKAIDETFNQARELAAACAEPTAQSKPQGRL